MVLLSISFFGKGGLSRMIVLKIIGALLAVIILLIAIILMLKFKLIVSYDKQKGLKVLYRILFFTFGKNPNPNSIIVRKLKRILEIDKIESAEVIKQDVEESGLSEAIRRIVTIVTLLAGRIFWLLKYCKILKLRIFAVCADEDAADAAIDYGLVCAAVYPFTAYLTSNIKTAKNAENIAVYCDFEGEKQLEFDLTVSVRIIHLLRALYRNAMEKAEAELQKEAAK